MDTLERAAAEQQQLEQAVQDVLALAKEKGASAAQVAITKQSGISVNTSHTQLENVEFNKDGSLRICTYLDQQKGVASTNDFSREALEKTVEAALDIARHTNADPYAGLPDPEYLASEQLDLDLYHPWRIDPDQAIDLVQDMARYAADLDPRLKQVDECSFSSHSSIHVLGNSHGFLKSYPTSRHSLSCLAIAEKDQQMQRDYDYHLNRRFDQLHSTHDIAKKAVEKTIARLGASSIPTQTAPIVFSPEMAIGLFSHFASAISGSQLYRKTSFLLDSLGQRIFPSWLSILDDPHTKGALGSSPFDADGVRTRPSPLVTDGILQTYLLSAYAARRLDSQPTGHCGGTHNWQVSTTHATQAELLKEMGTGLYVTELMGQGVNIVTGDYSRGASGFWVENGQITRPVTEITIAGNLRDMMQTIQGLSNDPSPNSPITAGSVWIENMQIAGS